MTDVHNATQGDVLAAVVQTGQALYLAQESTAQQIADGAKQQADMSQDFVNQSQTDVTNSINEFNKYEAEKRAAEHSSFWGSLFGWVLTIVAVVASAFAGPEMLAMTLAMLVLSKTGVLNDAENALAKVVGSKLVASLLLTAVLAGAGAGAGGVAALADDGATVVAEEATQVVADDSSVMGKVVSKLKNLKNNVANKVKSLSRPAAGALNGLGQGLQNFNVGGILLQDMSSLHAKWASALGVTLDAVVNIVALAAEAAGAGNGIARSASAGKGFVGSSLMAKHLSLFKGVGMLGVGAAAAEGSCSMATGAFTSKEAAAVSAYTQYQAAASFESALQELSESGFGSWMNSQRSLEQALARQANEVAASVASVNTQLAIAMSSKG